MEIPNTPKKKCSQSVCEAPSTVHTADDACDFKENFLKPLPAITTRHLQTGERSFVCKTINTQNGLKRMLEALLGRPLVAWRLCFKHRAADDSSDNDEPSHATELAPADADISTERVTGEDDTQVLGMGVACSYETCWFLSVTAFDSPVQFWGVCSQILGASNALTVTYSCQRVLPTLLRHGVDPSSNASCDLGDSSGSSLDGGNCRFWDAAVAVWAIEDEGALANGYSQGCTVGGTGIARVKSGKSGKGKKKKIINTTVMATENSKNLHKACLLHAPFAAGAFSCDCLDV